MDAGGLGPRVVRVGGLDLVLEVVLTRYGAGGPATAHVLLVSAPPSNLDPVGQGTWVNHVCLKLYIDCLGGRHPVYL